MKLLTITLTLLAATITSAGPQAPNTNPYACRYVPSGPFNIWRDVKKPSVNWAGYRKCYVGNRKGEVRCAYGPCMFADGAGGCGH
ncbi:hypothetical protein Ptr902_03649 [Pyrenophora tritici-repentis]|uniref:Uncharacterized protein n=1 Tax=Pyrenophora tritici-repentis TaxID=45151 RepID=A0A5M9L7Z2_9PLEO|nr:hypothetical protein PtrV1_08702 [Pyrenophora tritici-repentis]KAF7449743.1 hypothetical protein A1F99_067920 [Pyrenophora tritici-repentis]KAF7570130.1 hypothetical protein PtrM4_101320 [Pyrenophora tritici-repentis]KAI0588929.1 hypothetical protein Alg215_00593 [Pyrenophora tritici-repentis]KAI0591331.1 hypothetical protein Alg130_01396 [Pyrenophora tritici-repentis]